jgi:hypothetical protein
MEMVSNVIQLPLELRLMIYHFIFDNPSTKYDNKGPILLKGPEQIAMITGRGHQACSCVGCREALSTPAHFRRPVTHFVGNATFLAFADPVVLGDMHDFLKKTTFTVVTAMQVKFLQAWCAKGDRWSVIRKLRIDLLRCFRHTDDLEASYSSLNALASLIAKLPNVTQVEVYYDDLRSYKWTLSIPPRKCNGFAKLIYNHTGLQGLVKIIRQKQSIRKILLTGSDIASFSTDGELMDHIDNIHDTRDAIQMMLGDGEEDALRVKIAWDFHFNEDDRRDRDGPGSRVKDDARHACCFRAFPASEE